MSEPAAAATGRRVGRADGAGVATAAAIAALAGLAVQVMAARQLTPAQNADFLAFWSLLFAGYAVATGLQNETTRSVRAAMLAPGIEPGRPRVMVVAVAVGLAGALVMALVAGIGGERILHTDAGAAAALLAAGMIGAAGNGGTTGSLAGRGSWRLFAFFSAVEPLVRLVLVAAAVLAGAGLLGLEAATAAAGVTWLVLTLLLPRARTVWSLRADSGHSRYAARLLGAMAGAGANGILMVGFPTLVKVTTDAAVYAGAAPLILAVSMTRAPLLIPLNAFQGVVITQVVEAPRRTTRTLVKASGLILAVAAGGAALAAAVGPWLMELVFGDGYRVAGPVLAALTFAAGVLAVLVLAGATTLALRRHVAYVVGWSVAVVLSLAMLLLPLGLEARVVISLVVGPLSGIAVHVGAIRGAVGRSV
ncbi:MAG: polysaccharide biosynthesis protein [Georgenia sp.]